jgi:hypothetical protein
VTRPITTTNGRHLAPSMLENINEIVPQGGSMPNQNSLSSAPIALSSAGQRGRLALLYWILLVILSVGMLIASNAWGQAPAVAQPVGAAPAAVAGGRPLPPELTTKAAVSAMERAKAEGLTKADLSPQWANYSAFQSYYQKYLFGKLMDPAYVTEYGLVKDALLDDLDRAQKNRSQAFRLLSTWIVSGAGAVAAGNFHPAARVNATLLLAYVDEPAADTQTGPRVPASAALGPLVQLYRTDNNPDGVRAAALQGLLRHVQLGAVTKPQFRSGIASMMLQLAESEPPQGRSPEAHAFMQRYAVNILNILANPNGSPKTIETLVSLSTTAEKPNLIAAYAASKIGQLKPGQGKVNEPTKVLSSWAARAAATIDAELARLAKLDPPVAVRDQPAMPSMQTPMAGGAYGGDMYGPGGMGEMGAGMMNEMSPEMYGGGDMYGGAEMYGDMYGPGGMGMMAPRAKPQPPEIIASRRRINHVLQQLQFGVTGQPVSGTPRNPAGLWVTATENDKPAFDAWVKTVSDVTAAVNNQTLDERKKFVEELQKQSAALKRLAGVPVDPAAVAAFQPEDSDDLSAAPPVIDPSSVAPAAAIAQPGSNQPGAVVPAGGSVQPGSVVNAGAIASPMVAPAAASGLPGNPAAPIAPPVPDQGGVVPDPGDDLLQ